MPFSESLAARIRDALVRDKGVAEKTLFGGIGFLLDGNLLVGVWKDCLIARLGPDAHDEALLEPHVRQFDITGRPMRNWVAVEPEGVEDDGQLKDWIRRAEAFVETWGPPAPGRTSRSTRSSGRCCPRRSSRTDSPFPSAWRRRSWASACGCT